MSFNKPQIQLYKKSKVDASPEYILHCVTFFKKTNVRSAGHDPIPKKASDEDGIKVLRVKINIKKDSAIAELEGLTPVVHTINLGSPFGREDGYVDVELYIEGEEELEKKREAATTRSTTTTTTGQTTKKQVGKTSTGTADADDDSRPGGII